MSWQLPFALAMTLLGALFVIPVSNAEGFGGMGFIIALVFGAACAVGLGLLLCVAKATRPLGRGRRNGRTSSRTTHGFRSFTSCSQNPR
jgi:hypothetical protein